MIIKHYSEYIKESNSIDLDNQYVKQLKNKLNFQYKVRKNKYIKVKDVTGNIADDNLDLDILLSNKDKIKAVYLNGDLDISINGELIYSLDDIGYDGIINSIYKTYEKFLEQQDIKVIKKENPFS